MTSLVESGGVDCGRSSGEARGFAVGGCNGGLGAEPPAGSKARAPG